MNRIVLLVMCFSLALASAPATKEMLNSDYEIQTTSEMEGVICIKEIIPLFNLDSTKANVEIKFDVNVTPPKTYYHTTYRNGVKYGGTLNIISIRYRSDANYALYSGYINPIE